MRLFYVIIVPLIWEGVNVIPSPVMVKKNNIHIGFVTEKRPKTAGKRAMSYDNKPSEAKNLLDSIVVAIDTGNLEKDNIEQRKADLVDSFVKSLGDFVKKSVDNPEYRSKAKEYDIQPELVQIRGEKPSLMLSLNSETIVSALKDILKSKLAHRLIEKMAKKESEFLFPLVDE